MTFSQAWSVSKLFRIFMVSSIALILVLIFIAATNDRAPSIAPNPSAASTSATALPSTMTRAEAERGKQQLRIAYGKMFDEKMIGVGLESTTSAVGQKNTTLRIEYALAGRVTAKQLEDALDFPTMSQLGFKKVYFTNGFDGDLHFGMTWTVN